MIITSLFTTPVYLASLKDSELAKTDLSITQAEFQKVYDDHIKHNKFSDPWRNGRLGVSGGNFNQNIIEEYDCQYFQMLLMYHIGTFMKSLGEDPERSFVIKSSWMTQSLKHSYGHIHNHAPHDLSGCYYFKKSDIDGDIFFMNPVEVAEYSPVGRKSFLKKVQKHPGRVGDLLLFPSWLNHGVDTNLSDDERISISFNIDFR